MAITPSILKIYDMELGYEPDHTVVLHISGMHRGRFDALPVGPSDQPVLVFDTITQRWWKVSRASCGLDCYCAAVGVMVDYKDEP